MIDPLTEQDRRTTPYGYTFDDPIRHTDPDGMFGEDANDDNGDGDCCRTAKIIMGTGLVVAGGEVAVAAPTIVGEVVAVPAAVATVVVTAAVAGTALIADALFGSHSNSTPLEHPAIVNSNKKADDTKSNTNENKAPGQTAAGHPTDAHGNKLGPSGKPQVDQVDHASQKRAKDAARNEGQGAPVKHPSPTKGKPHYHPTDKNGEKKPTSTHHNYPG